MNKITALLLAITVCFSCSNQKKSNQTETSNEFIITITGQEHFPDGVRASIYRMKIEDVANPVEYLKKGIFTEEGFVFTGIVDDPHIIGIDILPVGGEYPYNRVYLVLEPGTTAIKLTSQKDFKLEGGRLNELVVNSWNNDLEYINALKVFQEFNNSLGDRKLERELRKEFGVKMRAVNDAKNNALGRAFNSTEDSFEKLLIYSIGYSDTEDREAINAKREKLALNLFEKREAKLTLKSIKMIRESAAARATVGLGAIIKDFEAKDLQGETFHLANVLKQNKYVLVEFWASWCGPCRAEIPHMKKAYSHYKDKGFEIVSFTLDHNKEKWEEASNEDQIPWINTGDLLAQTSPVVKLYGVTGVPANYLVEATSGKIIAMDLRGEKLDHKLEELLGK